LAAEVKELSWEGFVSLIGESLSWDEQDASF